MPVYEYYCQDCHTIYSFRSSGFEEKRGPKCPDCGKGKLEKQISMFAISKGRSEEDADFPDLDETAMEKAMAAMESEMSGMDEEDPRAMARFMRKLYDTTGLKLGDGIEEAIRRMEAGEDPDKIEEEMGDELDGDDMLFAGKDGSRRLDLKGIRRKLTPPRVDKTLYEM